MTSENFQCFFPRPNTCYCGSDRNSYFAYSFESLWNQKKEERRKETNQETKIEKRKIKE